MNRKIFRGSEENWASAVFLYRFVSIFSESNQIGSIEVEKMQILTIKSNYSIMHFNVLIIKWLTWSSSNSFAFSLAFCFLKCLRYDLLLILFWRAIFASWYRMWAFSRAISCIWCHCSFKVRPAMTKCFHSSERTKPKSVNLGTINKNDYHDVLYKVGGPCQASFNLIWALQKC